MHTALNELTDALENLNAEMYELNGETGLEFTLNWSPYAWIVSFAEFPILSDQDLIWDEETDTEVPIEQQLRHRFKRLQERMIRLVINNPTMDIKDDSFEWI